MGNLKVTTPSDREIALTRVFDAPRTLVFDAHTKPDLVRQWLLGPPGWSMPVCEMDVRVGGTYRWVWRHDRDGTEMGMGGVYREIVKPERLVYSHVSGPRATVNFTDQGTKTGVRVRMVFRSVTERDDTVKKFGAIEGLNQTLGRLAEHLAQLAS